MADSPPPPPLGAKIPNSTHLGGGRIYVSDVSYITHDRCWRKWDQTIEII